MAEMEINEQMQVRINKMKELESKGIDPFGHRFEAVLIPLSRLLIILIVWKARRPQLLDE